MSIGMSRLLLVLILVPSGLLSGNVASALAQTAQIEREETEEPEERELETDRDAFTPATSTVGKGLSVLESSYSFIDNRNVAATNSFPELLVRYGFSERIELRL